MTAEPRRAEDEDRRRFLFKIYDQMFNDINRHIVVVWQSVGVLVTAFAVFSLAEKQVLSFDVATALIVLLAAWLLAHLHDAAYWYNRNLAIIANIERQFLLQSDLKDIHYYFGAHRPKNRMLTHLKIQYALGVSIAGLMLVVHLFRRVVPGFGLSMSQLDLERALPYAAALAAWLYLHRLAANRRRSYEEFLRESPGAAVDTTGVRYGVGHGFRAGDGQPGV